MPALAARRRLAWCLVGLCLGTVQGRGVESERRKAGALLHLGEGGKGKLEGHAVAAQEVAKASERGTAGNESSILTVPAEAPVGTPAGAAPVGWGAEAGAPATSLPTEFLGKIPKRLILTGRRNSLSEMPLTVQMNVKAITDRNPDLTMVWYSDQHCLSFIKEHFDQALLDIFQGERHGSYRGDICRAAVLYQEGGFYVDLDLELVTPLTQLVDSETTFMSAYTADGAILNALIAAEPRSRVIEETLTKIREWYSGKVPPNFHKDGTQSPLMGPLTMLRALKAVTQLECPSESIKGRRSVLRWNCGNQVLRLYEEKGIRCPKDENEVSAECPADRRKASFVGLKFGLYVPGPDRQLVGWSRFSSCDGWGCHGGGYEDVKLNEVTGPGPDSDGQVPVVKLPDVDPKAADSPQKASALHTGADAPVTGSKMDAATDATRHSGAQSPAAPMCGLAVLVGIVAVWAGRR